MHDTRVDSLTNHNRRSEGSGVSTDVCLRGRANADADILEMVSRVEEEMNCGLEKDVQ